MVGAIDGVVVHLLGRENSNSATLHVFPRDAVQIIASLSSNTERVAEDSRHRHPFGSVLSKHQRLIIVIESIASDWSNFNSHQALLSSVCE